MTQPNQAEVITRIAVSRISDMFTASVGRVEATDPSARTVDVVPIMRRPMPKEDGSIAFEDLPMIPGVPVLHWISGAARITAPVDVGSFGLLVHLYSSIASWQVTQSVPSDPDDGPRLHYLGNAIFLPGILPASEPLPQAAINALVLEHAAIWLGANATEKVAVASLVEAEIGRLETRITAIANACQPGGGVPLATTPASAVGSSKVKIEL